MARPKKTEKEDLDLEKWRQRVVNAEGYLRANGRVKEWREIRDYYAGRLPTAGIKINLLFSIGRALVPQIYYKNPAITIRPAAGTKDPALARQKAKVLEAVDQQIIVQNLLKSQYKLGILDCFRFNVFIMKHGFSSISTELPKTAKEENVDEIGTHPLVEELLSEMGIGIESPEGMVIDERLRRHSYHDLIIPNSPWSLRVPPEDFLVPWGTRNMFEAPWCAFKVRRPLDDVKADPNYNKAVTKNMNGNWGQGSFPGEQLPLPLVEQSAYPTQFKEFSSKDDRWLMFYEVWDKRSGRVLTFALDEGTDFMRAEKHNLPLGLPVSVMQFNEEGEDFWGPSDAAQVLPLAKERNETRSIELEHKKIMLTKLLVQKDAIDKEQRARLTSGRIGPVIEVDGLPQQVAMQISPTISREIFQIDEVTREDVREVIGYSRNAVGEFESSRKTATEVNVVQQNLMLRGDERRDLMGDFIAYSFRACTNPMVFAFWDTLRYVELQGVQQPIGFIGTQLAGEYILTIAADSTLPISRAMAKAEAIEIFKIGKGDVNFNQAELYRYLLEQFETAPVDRLLVDPATAAANQMQMLLAMGMMQNTGRPAPRPGGNGNGEGGSKVTKALRGGGGGA